MNEREIAWEREATPWEPCVRGTEGCSIAHEREDDLDGECETW